MMANADRHMNLDWLSAAWGTGLCLAWSALCLASDAPAGLLACRNISDAAARLACFDREAASLTPAPTAGGAASPIPAPIPPPSSATAATASATAATASVPPAPLAPAPVASTAVRPAQVLDPQQQFGLPERAVAAKEVAAGTRSADATKIEAHLAGIAPAVDGRAVFTLDNGQVWRQLSTEADLLAKQGDAVTISRGLLGSYWLALKSKRGCKVTRLR
jgi:hypothetical protein